MSQPLPVPATAALPPASHTQVPNIVFDSLLAELSGAQLKVLLYIIRRLAGFHKTADRIAIEQIVHGIVTRDGRRLDHGAGVARSTAIEALQHLIAHGYLLAASNRSAGGRDLPTTYALGPRLLPSHPGEPSAPALAPPRPATGYGSADRTLKQAGSGPDCDSAPVRKLDGQKKGSQNKAPDSNRAQPVFTAYARPMAPAEQTGVVPGDPAAGVGKSALPGARVDPDPPYSPYIAGVVLDFSQSLGDPCHAPSNVTQALRLWRDSGQAEAAFVQHYLYTAYARVRVYQGRQGQGCIVNKMAYFFEVLRGLVTAGSSEDAAPAEEHPQVVARAAGLLHESAPARPAAAPIARGLDAHKYLHGKYAHLFGVGAHPARTKRG